MSSFRNPFAFVPLLGGTQNLLGMLSIVSAGAGQRRSWPPDAKHADHSRFLSQEDGKKRFTGRMMCRLSVLEVLVIGAGRTSGDPATRSSRQVGVFELGGKLALPASSLRGRLSSLAEAAFGGALRVLAGQAHSLSAGPHRRHPLGSAFEYFRKACHRELLPLECGDERQSLSLAEQSNPSAPDPLVQATAWRTRLGREHKDLLPELPTAEHVGDPGLVKCPVHYPQVEGPCRGATKGGGDASQPWHSPSSLAVAEVRIGTVAKFLSSHDKPTPFAALVAVNGQCVFLHVSEVQAAYIPDLRDVLSLNSTAKIKITSLTDKRGKPNPQATMRGIAQ